MMTCRESLSDSSFLDHRRRLARFAAVAGAAALLTACLPASLRADDEAATSELPNIVLILADDMGYGDPRSFYADSNLATPHLDELASQGMRFTDAHSLSGVCTPTRYGVMTGRYCFRTRLQRGVLWGASEPLIETDRTTLGSLLNDRGYQTGVVGKWHLGLGYARLNGQNPPDEQQTADGIDYTQPLRLSPNDLGFDYSMIIPASLDMPPYIFIENHEITEVPTIDEPRGSRPESHRAGPRAANVVYNRVLDDLLDSAVSFVERSAENDEPFFLYFPLSAPHKPISPNDDFHGSTEYGVYGDFISQVDWTVGQIMAKLEETGEAENTLFIFTSDNGSYMNTVGTRNNSEATPYNANGPLRGTKADIYEGGHRVPYIVRWPGHVAPQTECATTVCHTDLLATFAEVVGAELGEGAGPDSTSLVPLYRGEALPEPHPPIIHHSVDGMFSIRSGDWKLILGNGSGGRTRPQGTPFREPYQLYNIAEDLDERNNLIQEETEVAERLLAEFEAIRNQE